MPIKKMKMNMKRKYGRYHVKTILFFEACEQYPYGGALLTYYYQSLMGE